MNLSAIQSALRERNIDAWLFYDHHHRDPIAYRILGLPASLMVTRRWFYLVPAEGEPQKLVHKIEAGHLDSLPGAKRQYAGWQELFAQLKTLLAAHRDIAMQYSPNNLVFTISLVDGGTLDLIRGLGKNVVSSGDLVALFEATLLPEQIKTHFEARDAIDAITAEAFKEIGDCSRVRADVDSGQLPRLVPHVHERIHRCQLADVRIGSVRVVRGRARSIRDLQHSDPEVLGVLDPGSVQAVGPVPPQRRLALRPLRLRSRPDRR